MPRYLAGLDNQPSEMDLLVDKLNDFEEELRIAESTPSESETHYDQFGEILRISRERTQYAFDMWRSNEISHQTLEYLCDRGIVEEPLIELWQTNGYEKLCCVLCVDKTSHAGGACICRVPKKNRTDAVHCHTCHCEGCG